MLFCNKHSDIEGKSTYVYFPARARRRCPWVEWEQARMSQRKQGVVGRRVGFKEVRGECSRGSEWQIPEVGGHHKHLACCAYPKSNPWGTVVLERL